MHSIVAWEFKKAIVCLIERSCSDFQELAIVLRAAIKMWFTNTLTSEGHLCISRPKRAVCGSSDNFSPVVDEISSATSFQKAAALGHCHHMWCMDPISPHLCQHRAEQLFLYIFNIFCGVRYHRCRIFIEVSQCVIHLDALLDRLSAWDHCSRV